ncbi:hypothetical protein Isop_2578 [Isosphaera pallida ATCC 43644]|uniref:Thioredoxin-like fold domain-containing protein n=1 Tax=Isosphaera pallida (strain ATCC 43644 / DSM 9630 / IS1B) TaxID=575540 RepID=E8QZ07_ISOPI|nr:thioredoxin family protein [Isosphaera pallida]ADV63149.1 hypothetical protein Isop_2578 [Isosphaera pallida ATCC 43644]
MNMNLTRTLEPGGHLGAIRVEVLGPGCPRCERLAQRVECVLEQLPAIAGRFVIVKVQSWTEMLSYEGVRALPALALDGQVVCWGRVPSVEELAGWLINAERNPSAATAE